VRRAVILRNPWDLDDLLAQRNISSRQQLGFVNVMDERREDGRVADRRSSGLIDEVVDIPRLR
jgi:hypothetical protein